MSTKACPSNAPASSEARGPRSAGFLLLLGAAFVVVMTAPDSGVQLRSGPTLALVASNFPTGTEGTGADAIKCEARGRVVRRQADTKRKVMALTFDDGPSDSTNKFIRVLDDFDAHGTFFAVGQNIRGREQVVARAAKREHSVGNHSYTHANLGAGGSRARGEIRATNRAIRAATGVRPCVFRPPYGSRSAALDAVARDEELIEVLWNVDTEDYKGIPTPEIRRRGIRGIGRGNVILFHDGGGDERNTLAALPGILREMERRNYEAVTIPKLFHLNERDGKDKKR